MDLKEQLQALTPEQLTALIAELLPIDTVRQAILAASETAGGRFFTQNDIDTKVVPRAMAPKPSVTTPANAEFGSKSASAMATCGV